MFTIVVPCAGATPYTGLLACFSEWGQSQGTNRGPGEQPGSRSAVQSSRRAGHRPKTVGRGLCFEGGGTAKADDNNQKRSIIYVAGCSQGNSPRYGGKRQQRRHIVTGEKILWGKILKQIVMDLLRSKEENKRQAFPGDGKLGT